MDNEKLNGMLKGVWDSLTDEQKEKAKECKTADELIKLAGEEGIELPDEVLDAVAGGYLHLCRVTDSASGELLYYQWEVIQDSDGARIGFSRNSDYATAYDDAKNEAAKRGYSIAIINDSQLQMIRQHAAEMASGC